MRVILSYRNQKISESTSAVEHANDYFEQQENLPSPSHNISDNLLGEEKETTKCYNTEEFVEPQSKVTTKTSQISCQRLEEHLRNDLEQKLPALRSGEDSRKRKHLPIESGVLKKACPSFQNNESKKPPAKMTAGRYPDEIREPPPILHEENSNSSIDEPAKDNLQENFRKALKQGGLEIREQEGDGNCLFRSVSFQVYGDANMHMDVRQQCLDHMSKDEEHFSHFVEDEEFGAYIQRKRKEGVHGNNPEIQAISELFNRPVEVFTPENGGKPLNIFQSEYKTSDVPIRLSYHDNHYDAVVDPLLPTAGLGLGLPGLQPGLADKMQLDKAVRESDQLADQVELKKAMKESHEDQLQRALKESALSVDQLADQVELKKTMEESHDDQLQRALKESTMSVDQMYSNKAMTLSDLEATNFDLEQAVLESSLDTFRKSEAGRKQKASDQASSRIVDDSVVASIPPSAASPPAAALPFASVATYAAASVPVPEPADPSVSYQATLSTDEYPSTVQELVMNGFELSKVVHAYELIGDNFDDLLTFLVSTNAS